MGVSVVTPNPLPIRRWGEGIRVYLLLLPHFDLDPDHALRLDPLVKLRRGQVAQLEREFLQQA